MQAQAAQRRKEQRASQLQQWLREADAILNQGLETLETELVLAQQAEAKAEAAALAAQAAESEHTQQPMAEDKIEPEQEPEPPIQDDGPSYSPW